MKAIYAGPRAQCFDVMAIHPYAHPTENGLADLQQWVDQTRAYLRSQNDRRQLWLTEVGWSTGPHVWGKTTISEQQQAGWVTSVYRDLGRPQKVFWYNFKDNADPAMTNPEYYWRDCRLTWRPNRPMAPFRPKIRNSRVDAAG